MEKPKRAQPKRTASQSSIQIENHGGVSDPMKKPSFRNVARQVLIANSFTRRKAPVTTKTSATKRNNDRERAVGSSRPPSVKRKGTPEIFPMSSEMKKTLLLLGKMDLVPEGENSKEKAGEVGKKGSKFRQKTRLRIIQPQRFIRRMQSSAFVGKSGRATINPILEEKETGSFPRVEKIGENTAFVKTTSSFEERHIKSTNESPSSVMDIENISDEETERLIIGNTPPRHMEKRLGTPSSIGFDRIDVLAVDSYRKPYRLTKTYPPTKNSTARRQNIGDIDLTLTKGANYTPRAKAKRIVSENGSGVKQEYGTKPDHAIRHWRSVEQLTNDIQNRCSRWFEFRRTLLEQNGSYSVVPHYDHLSLHRKS